MLVLNVTFEDKLIQRIYQKKKKRLYCLYHSITSILLSSSNDLGIRQHDTINELARHSTWCPEFIDEYVTYFAIAFVWYYINYDALFTSFGELLFLGIFSLA